ncbi:MAG: hypothetical protein IPP07_12730 [Holophagales bacterium]|nr:hypothetical protein [Holophagales bacterium]
MDSTSFTRGRSRVRAERSSCAGRAERGSRPWWPPRGGRDSGFSPTSLLVSREDTDLLASSVRDLTLLADAESLLGLGGATEEAFTGGEPKRRIDLFPGSSPKQRVARRAATLLLGERSPGPARLIPLDLEEFRREFREGEIPQERQGGDPDAVAQAWARERSWRLDGAADLGGAVEILGKLVA